MVEYDDQELQSLLALEKPKKKKRNNSNKKGPSQVICHACHQSGHYANKCHEKRMTESKEDRTDLNLVTCFKCKEKGYSANE